MEEFQAELDPAAAQLDLPRFNIAHAQVCPVVRAMDGAGVLTSATWGLALGERVLVNVQSEHAGRHRGAARCLIPADGFCEWTGPTDDRHPRWFHEANGGLLVFAGLLWPGNDAGPPTLAITTMPAAPPVAAIHARMPVVMAAVAARAWLLGVARPRGPPVRLVGIDVSGRVNRVANEGTELLEPAGPPRQGRLF